ncbi:GNAT family N-acetyltransferase [Sporosarcina trichiuri]|uniref:GNAT family N-acetyltransferase n=1 Tax=Sporosarcina trichiuri TaxID=3056445 RepID=UPI0025B3EF91|nr:GNAT family N-acetyltransferase [Sporosarcina sp. 0.2-SM1T-5]WJY28097.1 GNAT family N-acetyltransferase [Sporosarcina sp. 0.2-SM1T-5]
MQITYEPLSSLTFEAAHALFNRAFEGYLVPMHLTLDAFISRFGQHGLSPEVSIAAFDGDVPVGIVLQGIRETGGRVISWNGGTGIVPEYRGRKLGQPLMEAAEMLLTDRNVGVATLESISGNEAAIALYERCGYRITDRLQFLQADGILMNTLPELGDAEIVRIPAARLAGSSLFPAVGPLQTDPSDIARARGEAVLLLKNGKAAAACLVRKDGVFGEPAKSITLYQGVHPDGEDALRLLLPHTLEYDTAVMRKTYNFPNGDGAAADRLIRDGFERQPLSQVFMVKELS